MHMGSVECGYPVSILCVYMWGEGVVYSFACMRVGTFACVYGCLFVYVYVSGRALDSTSLIISVDPHPTTMPCRWRMPPVRWWFLAPGQDARVSAGPLSAVAWRGLALLAFAGPRLGGGGAFGSPGPGPGLPWCGRLPVEPAGLPPRHPGASTLWLSGGHTFGLSSALFWVEAAVVPAVGSPGGPVSWGAPGCLGPGSFPCLLHALRDGAVVPHTHY